MENTINKVEVFTLYTQAISNYGLELISAQEKLQRAKY